MGVGGDKRKWEVTRLQLGVRGSGGAARGDGGGPGCLCEEPVMTMTLL